MKIQFPDHGRPGLPTLCFKKVWKLRRHRRSQLGGALFPFLSGVTEFFGKMESKLLNSRVLAGGFVIECGKKSWF